MRAAWLGVGGAGREHGVSRERERGTREVEEGMRRVRERGHYGALEKARGKGEQMWGSEEERSSGEPLKDTAYLGRRLWGEGREPQLLPGVGNGHAGRSVQDVATSSTLPCLTLGCWKAECSVFLGSRLLT